MYSMLFYRVICLKGYIWNCLSDFVVRGRIYILFCKLLKSLYGLKQSSRKWNVKWREAFFNSDYTHSHLDYSMFTKRSGSSLVINFLCFADLLITRNDIELIEENKCV